MAVVGWSLHLIKIENELRKNKRLKTGHISFGNEVLFRKAVGGIYKTGGIQKCL